MASKSVQTLSSVDPSSVKPQESCRVCKAKNLVTYFDFGLMPLANRNLSLSQLDLKEPVFPLQLLFCKTCGLSQLSLVVAPEVLYQGYTYHSSVSQTFQQHCREIVSTLKQHLDLKPKGLVVEIASNDGCLLSKFAESGFQVIGVEPAKELASLTQAQGFTTFCQFWGPGVAVEIQRQFGKVDLVIGTNVMAHVDDLDEFLGAVNSILGPEGHLVFEVPYMANYIEQLEFDTTYHEHLSYFLLSPLKRVLEANGFCIIDVQRLKIHGGSIRVICGKKSAAHAVSASVEALLTFERDMGLLEEDIYLKFAARIHHLRDRLRLLLSSLKQKSKHIAAYGASAKGNILLNYCGIGKETIDYIIDDTPQKQGKFQSGTHIPIVDSSRMLKERPDYLLILAWNFTEELMNKTAKYYQTGGNYIVPIPEVKVLNSSSPL